MTCAMVTRTSITSPRCAVAGNWISVRTMLRILRLDARGQHDDHVHGVGPQAAVVHARERDQLLAGGEAHARGDVGPAVARAQRETGHVTLRVLLVEDGDLGH